MGMNERVARELLEKQREVLYPIVEEHGGKVVKEIGDGTLSSFGSAIGAVNCAIELQKALRGNEDLRLRIGIHEGDVVVERNDILGDGVNIASRIEPMAAPGGICISEKVYDEVKNQPGMKTKSLGRLRLKNVQRPIELFALVGEGLPEPKPAIRSIQRTEEETRKRKSKVLIIDDEVSLTHTIKLILEESGDYEVAEENDGTKALATARRFRPDLILLDVVMPEIDGGEVAFQVQADEDLSEIPIVFLTGVVTRKEEGMIGGRHFIAKPVTKNKLIDCVNKNMVR